MKNFIYKLFVLAAASLIYTGCSTDDIDTYNGEENAIRFPGVGGTGADGELVDSSYSGYNAEDDIYYGSYSFMENPLDESTEYKLPLSIVGMTQDTDRKVNVKVLEEGTTAPQGSYEILESVIPADEREGYIRIKLANTSELTTTSYQLKVELLASEDFKLGPKEYLTAVLTWNNVLPKPTNTHLIRSYNMIVKGETSYISTSLNSYSTSAHLAIVDALGWDDWGDPTAHLIYNNAKYDNFYNYLPRYAALLSGELYKAYAKKLDEYLKAYEAEHGSPLLHDGGKLEGQPVEARQY
ncbi:MAG: DUF4843 domain-containing protein [Bacteroides sp.]|nr:DUF4843 domain-containing protein [Bacteroides sp.]